MTGVRIVTDSGSDLPREVLAKYDIRVVPLTVRFGQDLICDADLTPDEFWARAARSNQVPGTSAPSPGAFQEAFRRLVDEDHDVLCFTLPGNYSSTYNNAWLAAQEFGQRVRVLDSGSISVGMGLQVLSAAKNAMAGLALDRVFQEAESLQRRTSVIFALDTLEWVRRGGRIDRLLPLIDRVARTFHVKPVIELAGGEMHLLGVVRSHRNALRRIEEEVSGRLPIETFGAAYTRGREAAVELTQRIQMMVRVRPIELELCEAGPVFAAHAGPNAVGAAIVCV